MRTLVLLGLTTCLTLAGCDSGATSNAMDLLRSGSGKICAAPIVEDTLRGLILPKPAALDNVDATVGEKTAAIAAVNVSFDATTMTGFDDKVTKASCQTTAKITLPDGSGSSYSQNFDVSPSAQDDSTVVVSADTTDPRTAALTAVDRQLATSVQNRADAAARAQEQQKRTQILQVATHDWLMGRWIDTDGSRLNCTNGPFIVFRRGGIFEAPGASGSWRLEQDTIFTAGEKEDGDHFAYEWKLTQADADSFSVQPSDGSPLDLSRCAPSEIRKPHDSGSSSGEPSDASGSDASGAAS